MTTELNEAIKEAQRLYKREWYAKNKEKQKEYNRRYWQRKIAKLQLKLASND